MQYDIGDSRPDSFDAEMLAITEVDTAGVMVVRIVFDLDDFEAAVAELDARYLAGEGAAHANTWSLIARTFTALNRHELAELPATTPGYRIYDHRLQATVEAADLTALFGAMWDLTPELLMYVEAVHRLNDHGALITQGAHGTSRDGFDAQWRMIQLLTVEGELGTHCELFDEKDIDAAIARFDELSQPAPRLENAATRVAERYRASLTAHDWDAIAEIMADDISSDDRRRVVNAGIRRGPQAEIDNMRAATDLGATVTMSDVIATREERLALLRIRVSVRDQEPSEFGLESLNIVEIDTDVCIAAIITFDPDDIDAAFEELDARYLAGEAAGHAHTWSLITRAYAGFNRGELPASTGDWTNIDHRHAAAMAPGEGIEYFRASWEQAAELSVYIESVHRLSDFGAVFTHVGKGTSRDGFEAEWRTVDIMTVEGDLIKRGELFDEADLDAALARFEELHRQTPRLENAASKVGDRFCAQLATRDEDAITEILAADICLDDRRRMVNSGVRQGRDAVIADMRAAADWGVMNIAPTVIATRGERLAISRTRYWGRDQRPDAFVVEALHLAEIDADERIAAYITFDPDDIDAAFEELDTRYLAGEAAPHAHTWSVITQAYASLNRREIAATTTDLVNLDHRRVAAFAPGDLIEFIRAAWELEQDVYSRIETVHRLNDLGAAVTRVTKSTSREGFDAEWRTIDLVSVEGEQISRFEMFDDADLDAALARFDELSKPRLENAASQAYERLRARFEIRDWAAVAEMLADLHYSDDRRRVINAGTFRGRDAEIASMRAAADLGVTSLTSVVIATRGDRLALCRTRGATNGAESFDTELLRIVEIDAAGRLVARVVFDLDDIDAALKELDSRYLTGEAAPYSRVWSVVTHAYSALNRHEIPLTAPETVDHRRLAVVEAGDLIASLDATFGLMPDAGIYVESVHRLADFGAVVTHVAHGTAEGGLNAEWRAIDVQKVAGDRISHCEIFDEADIGKALARFDELSKPRLENTASRAYELLAAYIADRDWVALAETLADDFRANDRRPVVGAGIQDGRDALIADLRVTAELGIKNVSSAIVATRGDRLVLVRARYSRSDQEPGAFLTEVLNLFETNADGQVAGAVVFAYDELDAALDELDAWYLAGEAAAHARTWSVITGSFAAVNRHELPELTQDWVNIDHRRAVAFAPGDMTAYIRATLDDTPDFRVYLEAVHRLSDLGAVVTWVSSGTSQAGFQAEWREINIATVDGDLINRSEMFGETDLDAALAKFDELHQQVPRLENAASRVIEHFQECFAARDWSAMAEILAEDVSAEDRRAVVRAGIRRGRDTYARDWQTFAEVGFTNITTTVIATRGERLVLGRHRVSRRDEQPHAFVVEVLAVIEIDGDDQVTAIVAFGPDDVDAAFAELDTRYLAGDATAHTHTWSVIARAHASINRHELPATTPDWVNLDHRRGRSFAPGGLTENIRANLDLTPDLSFYIEAVHRLTDLGVVITSTTRGTSKEGFDAEWKQIDLLTVEGDRINRCELFDEADIGKALARFDELHSTAPRLENAASQSVAHFSGHTSRPATSGLHRPDTGRGRLSWRPHERA